MLLVSITRTRPGSPLLSDHVVLGPVSQCPMLVRLSPMRLPERRWMSLVLDMLGGLGQHAVL